MCGDGILALLLIPGLLAFLLLYPLPSWIILADPPRLERKPIIKMNLLWGWTVFWMDIRSRVGLFRAEAIPLTKGTPYLRIVRIITLSCLHY